MKFWIKVKAFLLYFFYLLKTRNTDYFEYRKLAIGYPIFSISNEPGIIGNKCYGNIRAIKGALKANFSPNCMIEHGVYFGEFVIESECILKNIDTIYTYSNYRADSIRKHFSDKLEKKIVVIGPYIQYADNFKSKAKLEKIKKKYGRILLVFPTHGSPEVSVDYDCNSFLSEIDKISENYDSVFVSMFWLDIVRGYHLRYQERGHTIVCSGSRSDPRFLNRQRDLIELADMSISNDIGTHIGYCICLGTPHYVFRQKINVVMTSVAHEYESKYEKVRHEEFEEIRKTFSFFEPKITKEQLNIVKKYWGGCII